MISQPNTINVLDEVTKEELKRIAEENKAYLDKCYENLKRLSIEKGVVVTINSADELDVLYHFFDFDDYEETK